MTSIPTTCPIHGRTYASNSNNNIILVDVIVGVKMILYPKSVSDSSQERYQCGHHTRSHQMSQAALHQHQYNQKGCSLSMLFIFGLACRIIITSKLTQVCK